MRGRRLSSLSVKFPSFSLTHIYTQKEIHRETDTETHREMERQKQIKTDTDRDPQRAH